MNTKVVSCLDSLDAVKYLQSLNMRVGEWSQISTISELEELSSIHFKAPTSGIELRNFASHAAGWLAKGEWKIFQMDNSNYLDATQAYTLSRLLFGTDEPINFAENRTFLFEFDKGESVDKYTEILISNLIHLFLLYESHGQLVSSNSLSRKILSIQDGFVYFISNMNGVLEAKTLINDFESRPLDVPSWIADFIIETQG